MDVKATENFRKNLQTAIECGDLSQSEVARRLGVARPYVHRVIHGHTVPGLDQCERLAIAVGFPLIALLGDPETFSESVLVRSAT